MHLDVLDLRNFYYRSALGRSVQRALRQQMAVLWPEAKGQTVVGFGFATPLLRPYMTQSRRTIALMPGPQGVMPWPAGAPNIAVLCEDTLWPIETGSVDKLVLLHGLETSENPGAVLREAYRVLGPGGKVLAIVPNRTSIWARRDKTPFGYGRPYSLGQLESQLRETDFLPGACCAALFAPPSNKRFWLRTSGFWEGAGRKLPSVLAGGALMVEAAKQVPAPTRPGLPEAVKRPLRVLDGIAGPEAKPI